MKTERGEYQVAWYDSTNWVLFNIEDYPMGTFSIDYINIENAVKALSKRNTRLYAIFVNAYIPGGVICSEPQMLFLHGIRYDIEGSGMTPLQVIIDNAKDMGI